MQNLLNHNNQQATIEVNAGYTENNKVFTESKTWDQLTDSNKQDIASQWIREHVYCNVNQVMELLAQNEDHCDFDEYQSIAEYQDFEEVSVDHINDLSIDELIEVIEEYDLTIDVENFFTEYKTILIKEINEYPITKDNLINTLEELDLFSISGDEQDQLDMLIEHITDVELNNDKLETIFVNLGLAVVPFDFIENEHKNKLESLIIKELDLNQYGQDNNLDPEYQEAYEFWSVSDHFVSMLSYSEQCSNDILGLSVWARYCTGQSICLDHAIQVAAFKVLSDCSYTNY